MPKKRKPKMPMSRKDMPMKGKMMMAEEDMMPASKGKKKPKGFNNVQKSIAKKQGIPMKKAGAILAAKTRAASPEAKKKNPALKKVKGKPKKGKK